MQLLERGDNTVMVFVMLMIRLAVVVLLMMLVEEFDGLTPLYCPVAPAVGHVVGRRQLPEGVYVAVAAVNDAIRSLVFVVKLAVVAYLVAEVVMV